MSSKMGRSYYEEVDHEEDPNLKEDQLDESVATSQQTVKLNSSAQKSQ